MARRNQELRIDQRTLQQFVTKDNDEILLNFSPARGSLMRLLNTSRREEIVQSSSLLPLILRIILKAFDAKMSDDIRNKFMQDVLESKLFNNGLFQSYVSSVMISNSRSQDELKKHADVIDMAVKAMNLMYHRFEEIAYDQLSAALLVLDDFAQKQRPVNPNIHRQLLESVSALKDTHKGIEERLRNRYLKERSGVRNAVDNQPANVNVVNYREMSVVPTMRSLNQRRDDELKTLMPIEPMGPFENVQTYLNTHFRLLLEDFVGPLRDGLCEYRDALAGKRETRRNIQDIRVYEGVHVVCAVGMLDSGIAYRVRFTTGRTVNWETSKRLTFGSLVCLSADRFKTAYFGTVADRNLGDLKKGIVTVRFEAAVEGDDAPSKPIANVVESETFSMVESSAYFAAYKHVLQRLQQIGVPNNPQTALAFERYFVHADTKAQSAAYLRRSAAQFNFEQMLTKNARNMLPSRILAELQRVPILDMSKWPTAEQLGLEKAQSEAMRYALTNELAVIVGPPGTGKTYIGLRICELLLRNTPVWNGPRDPLDDTRSPILVVCYTNHALDQFLSGILNSGIAGLQPGAIVRIGGRIKTEYKNLIEPITIRNLRDMQRNNRSLPPAVFRVCRDIREKMDQYRDNMAQVTAEIEASNHGVARLSNLKEKLANLERSTSETDCLLWRLLASLADDVALQRWLLGYTAFSEQPVGNFNPPDPKAAAGDMNQTMELLLLDDGDNDMFIDEEAIMEDGEVTNMRPELLDALPLRDRWRLYRAWLVRLSRALATQIELCLAEERAADAQLGAIKELRGHVGGQPGQHVNILRNAGTQLKRSRERRTPCERLFKRVRAVIYLDYEQPGNRPDYVSIDDLAPYVDANIVNRFRRVTQNGNGNGNAGQLDLATWLSHGVEPQNDGEPEDLIEVAGEADRLNEARMLEEQFFAVARNRATQRAEGALQKAKSTTLALTVEQLECVTRKPQAAVQTGFSTAGNQRQRLRRFAKLLRDGLARQDVVEDEQLGEFARCGLQQIRPAQRWSLYNRWIRAYHAALRRAIHEEETAYDAECRRFEEARRQQDLALLKGASLIALTTTGASMHHALLDRIAPRIVIVEEAAEVLEAHVIASLSSRCEHLIMIGDHKQLRPSVNAFQLAKEKNLDLSLFERLIKNQLDWRILDIQHRMSPQIAQLTTHFYHLDPLLRSTEITNHESVHKYEPVRGVRSSVFFFSHQQLEDSDKENLSHSNRLEADLIPPFVKYLIQQGYKQTQITVLTMYTGQLFALRERMKKCDFEGVQVTVVDNYQGEENDIIVLSLVRSNKEARFGFVGIQNRILVSLSRAKKGLFVFGNFTLLAKNEDWNAVLNQIKLINDPPLIGEALPLCCQQHPGRVTFVSKLTDFRKVPEGGCGESCSVRLPCGHACERTCHAYDREHKTYKCLKQCGKSHCGVRGHVCPAACHSNEVAHRCSEKVSKTVPQCGHVQTMACYQKPEEYVCQAPSKLLLDCGHLSSLRCAESRRVARGFQDCATGTVAHCIRKHAKIVSCRRAENAIEYCCEEACGINLSDCEHQCSGTCGECINGRLHKACSDKCTRILICGHLCNSPCARQCPPCMRDCENKCTHSKCPKKCGQPCAPCAEPCDNCCEHSKCTRRCSEPCNRQRCSLRCDKTLPCGHQCVGICGEQCPPACRECDPNHEVFSVFLGSEDEPDALFIVLEDCKHIFALQDLDTYMDIESESIQMRVCPRCSVPIRRTRRYKTILNKILSNIERVKSEILGNASENRAKEYVADLKQKRMQELKKDSETDKFAQSLLLKQKHGNDNSIDFLGEHLIMIDNWITLAKLFDSLDETRIEMVTNAIQIPFASVHIPVNHPIFVTLKDVCSEQQHSVSILRDWLFQSRRRLSTFECTQFSFEVKRIQKLSRVLACYAELTKHNEPRAVAHKVCAEKLLQQLREEVYAQELDDVVSKWIRQVQQDLGLFSGIPGLSVSERDMIVKAMNYKKGHWYKCPNNHIYIITECGGAMMESKCPECGAAIGGGRHTLRSDNAVASEMDGAQYAAWSQQANMANYQLDDN